MSEIDTSDEAVGRDAAMCEAASHDDRLADGMLYRRAAEKLRALLRERNEARARVKPCIDLLGTARPDIAAILRGEAVAVPKEATVEMLQKGTRSMTFLPKVYTVYPRASTCYRAMLAASPYAQKE